MIKSVRSSFCHTVTISTTKTSYGFQQTILQITDVTIIEIEIEIVFLTEHRIE